MKLILLGTGGYHPNDRRQTPCLLLPEQGIMLDAGTGMYRAGAHLTTSELDIFLTHAHLDHVIGLTYLFDVVRQHPLRQVTVHATAETLQAVDDHLFDEALFPKKPPYRAEPLTDQVDLRDGGTLRTFPLEHQGGSTGFRLDWPGHSMAYVTDTTASPEADYVDLLHGVDLLLHECYFPDGNEAWAETTGHSCTTPVVTLAKKADVGRLVLIHINPLQTDDDPVHLEAARRVFPKTQLGEDGMELHF